MACGTFSSRLTAAILCAAEAAAVVMALALFSAPASAQLFDERFPFQNRRVQPRGPFEWFYPQPQEERAAPPQPPQDYSKAPSPKKAEPKTDSAAGASLNTVMVFGDSMADWLAYGLELAYADSPEMAVLRRHRTNSGLIRTETRSDPKENPDWSQAAREMIAAGKPKFVLMMIGVNDRRQIRETAQVARPARPAPARPDDPASLELDKPAPDKPAADKPADSAATTEPTAPTGNRTYEFRTDAWSEAYIRRIDDMVAALKTSAVPVFWVGLPPLRGQKAAADISFLNDLYRSRADKAGIIYIDVWDGFVDEDGRYAQSGPDYEGQIRRLRTGDGVHFTQAGARKLAHYVEREIQRWLNARGTQAALPVPDELETPAPAAPPGPGNVAGRHARPLAGPAVPLIGNVANESDEQLLGGNAKAPAGDALVAKVLVNGEAMRAPAGRADDFAWPRRDVAPVGSDPIVATTDLPMTPMVAEKPRTNPTTVASAAPTATGGAAPAAPPRPRRVAPAPRPTYAENQQDLYRPDYYRRPPTFFPFQSLFGGRW
jgi:hypothetical protein